MKELDFDELDRAVSTLMSAVPDSPPEPVEDEVKTVTIPSSRADDTADDVQTASPAFSPARRSAPLAARRSGRFMDMMHPSSDMKNPLNTSLRTTSRNAPTIQPTTEPAPVEPVAQTQSIPALTAADYHSPVGVTEQREAPAAQPDASADTEAWLDPLADFIDEAPATTDEQSTDTAPAQSSSEDEDEALFTIDETELEELEPLISPFLTDAKVSKRPLGGAAAPLHDEVMLESELGRAPVLGVFADSSMTSRDPEDQLPAQPAPSVVTELPAELQRDLMAIESSPAGDDEQALQSVQRPKRAVQPATGGRPVKAPRSDDAASGPTSIQPQYKEVKATGDQSNGSIYDTDAYHQPLAHPAKKKSGWMWIVWVLLLLVAGAGGAAALYLLDII